MIETKQTHVANRSTKSFVAELHGHRPVVLWNKKWIVGRWFLLVFLICFVISINICSFYLLIKYNPEDILYGVFSMLTLNLFCGGVLVGQARELVEDSKTVNDVPWWCYGCTNSSPPTKINSL